MSVKKKINRVIAIDLGNGLTNVRSSYEDGSPYSITLPSAFGFASNIGEAFGGAGEDIIVDYITVDGVEFVWGEDIHKVPQRSEERRGGREGGARCDSGRGREREL